MVLGSFSDEARKITELWQSALPAATKTAPAPKQAEEGGSGKHRVHPGQEPHPAPDEGRPGEAGGCYMPEKLTGSETPTIRDEKWIFFNM